MHKDHTSAVTCIDYAPTGKEFVSGSYDKSVRIYSTRKVSKTVQTRDQFYVGIFLIKLINDLMSCKIDVNKMEHF